jgi:hypothetical protein
MPEDEKRVNAVHTTPRNSVSYGDESAAKSEVLQIDNIDGSQVDVQWPLDPVKEKKVMRKVDILLVPWLFLLFLLAFLDRVNSTPPSFHIFFRH